MKKRLLSVLLCAALLFALLPALAGTASAEYVEPVTISFDPDTATFTWTGNVENIRRYHIYFYASNGNGASKDEGTMPEYAVSWSCIDEARYGADQTLKRSMDEIINSMAKEFWSNGFEREGIAYDENTGEVSLYGWFAFNVDVYYIDKFGSGTWRTNSCEVWIDRTFDGVVAWLKNAFVSTVNGEQTLFWDPCQNAEKYYVSVYGAKDAEGKENYLLGSGETTTETRYPLSEILENAARDSEVKYLVFSISAKKDLGITYAAKSYEFITEYPLKDSEFRWTPFEDGFTAEFGSATSVKKATFELVRKDFITFAEKTVASRDVTGAQSCDFAQEVVQYGSGWYRVDAAYTTTDGKSGELSTGYRYYRASDYLRFAWQNPEEGSTVETAVGREFTVSYGAEPLPRWMTNAGITVESPHIFVFLQDGDDRTILSSKYDTCSWRGSWTPGSAYAGTHEAEYNLRLKTPLSSWYTSDIVSGGFTLRVGQKSAEPAGFTRSPQNQVVKNGEGFTLSWKTNRTPELVTIMWSKDGGDSYSDVWTSIKEEQLDSGTLSDGVKFLNNSTTSRMKNERVFYILRSQVTGSNGREYSYSEPFTVTWTNDGEEPAVGEIGKRTVANGTNVHFAVPFNYGSANSDDRNSYKLYLWDNENNRWNNITNQSAEYSMWRSKTHLTFEFYNNNGNGYKYNDTTQRYKLTVVNAGSTPSIDTANVIFEITWADVPDLVLHKTEITNFSRPVAGASVKEINRKLTVPDTWHCHVGTVYWIDTSTNETMDEEDIFDEQKQYQLCFELVPDEVYEFDTNAIVIFRSELYAVESREILENGNQKVITSPESPYCATGYYQDVPASSNWAHSGIDYCVWRGIMGSTSTEELTFVPRGTCTRSQIASILYRLAGSPAVSYSAKFTDVQKGKWYTDAVIWCSENGIVSGSQNTNGSYSFKPDDKVTREQLAVMLKGFVTYKGGDTSGTAGLNAFADADKVTWSKAAVQWAVYEGIISGKAQNGQTLLDPQGSATRQEVASIFSRFCRKFDF